MKDYTLTPSFFTNAEYFNKYLGQTSYYRNLQKIVAKMIALTDSRNMLEMGCALCSTLFSMADLYPDRRFTGIDIREVILDEAKKNIDYRRHIQLEHAEMCTYAQNDLTKYDLIYMLYAFHHIPDPLENKQRFMQNCYKNMKPGAYLLIMETFLPEDSKMLREDPAISELFRHRAKEGYASTFWEALETIDEKGIRAAKDVAEVSMSDEAKAGENVFRRQDEFLVKFSWLLELSRQCGFKTMLAEPVNSICENALLLRR